MFFHNQNDYATRILCIDPGSSHLGLGCLECRPGSIKVVQALTISTTSVNAGVEQHEQMYGRPHSKRLYIGEAVFEQCMRLRPHIYAAESPFAGSNINAFDALVELRSVLRGVVKEYDPTIPFELVSPSQVKKVMGVSTRSSDKDKMKEALVKRADLEWEDFIRPDELSEHAVDAIAVGLVIAMDVMTL